MANANYSIKDVKEVLKNIDGVIKNVNISRLTALGENYLSLVFSVDVEVEKDGETQIVKTVAKCVPPSGGMPMSTMVMGSEIKWYAEIVPILKESGKELGIDTDFYPKLVGGRLSLDPNKTKPDKDAVLILENLIPEGYKNEDRHIGFDLSTAKAILTSLANFHALPLALKFKKPELFKILKEYLDSARLEMPAMPKDGEGPPLNPTDILFDKILELPQCKPYKAKIEALKQKPFGPDQWGKTGVEPWNTVGHNDFWVNNIMVKPREAKWPLVKIVDYQACSYSSFAKDLVFLLLTSLKSDLRIQETDNLLRFYYDQFTDTLNKLRIPELKLSYEDYLAEVKRVAEDGEVSHAIFFTTPIFGEKGKGPDLLSENVDPFHHIDYTINNMSDKQKEVLGYKNEDRHIGFDLSAAKAILTSLANFHALPLALKFKKPELFKTLKEFLDSTQLEMSAMPGESAPDFPEHNLYDKILELPQCKPYKANIESLKLKPNGPENWAKTGVEPWNTVVHCDFWVNNIMVKSREAKWPLVKIVDFQACTYSSFAKDLVFFLLTSLKSELRLQETGNLLRFYYDQLTSILDKLKIPELKLSYEDYLAEVKRVAEDGEVSHAIFFTTPIFGEKGKGPDFLAGNVDPFHHIKYTINNMSEKQKEVLGTIVELSVKQGWI